MPRKLLFKNTVISRIGFAGLRIEYGGTIFCIDPGSQHDECNIILCTHSHRRHCAELVGKEPSVYSPFTGTIVRPGSEFEVSGVYIITRDAYNDEEIYGSNPPHPRGLGVGYILVFPQGPTIYYTGDTSLVEDLVNPGVNIDILALPVGGGCVMSPEEAVELVKSIKPAISIPLHAEDPYMLYKFRDMAQPYTQVVLLWP